MKYSQFTRYTAFCFLCALVCFFTSCPNGAQQNGIYASGTAVTVNILDSVGGTPQTASTILSAYKAGTKSAACQPVTVSGGSAQLYLPEGQCYDLYLSGEKNKLAASVIENYWVKSANAQTVTMFQRTPQQGAATEAPSVQSVKLNGVPFEDSGVWSGAVDKPMVLEIVFRAPSRAIQAVPTNGNFGCAVAVGSSPSSRNKIASVSPECVRNGDGSWTCTARFNFDKISFPNKTDDFIISAYDTAGNRVERHINSIEFKERRPALTDISGSSVKDFRIEMHRFPHSLKLFSLPNQSAISPFGIRSHNGESNTYEVLLYFRVKDASSQDLPIRGYDIYRRLQGQTEWTHIGQRQYVADYAGENNPNWPSYKGYHLGYDTDTSLEENVTYEYQVRPFNGSGKNLVSPTATARLFPANTIELQSPADNGFVKKSELNNLSFSFRLTNPDIWEQKLADSFSFGLFVTEKTSNQKIIFAGKATFYLKKNGGEKLALQYAISGNPQEYSFKELQTRGVIASNLTEDDFISYKDGVITIKPAYLITEGFNHPQCKDEKFQTGVTYAWDIFDWGKRLKETYDDEPAAFSAAWKSKDVDGNEIGTDIEPLSSSESFANAIRYASSSNGQYFFRVTAE